MYSITIVLWRSVSDNDEEDAKAIARAKKTRYFKGYKQYYYGDEVLTIPGNYRTKEQLSEFFSKIEGKFLEKDKQLSAKYGRPDTSKDFDEIYSLWTNFREYALELKRKQKNNNIDKKHQQTQTYLLTLTLVWY